MQPRARPTITLTVGVLLLSAAAFSPLPLLGQDAVAPAAGRYRMGAGDQVEIRVFGQPEFSVQMRVPPDGSVSFPGLSSVSLLDRTPSEVEVEIASRLRDGKFLKSPLVTVLVVEFAPRPVYVLGRVREPGEFEIPIGRDLLLSHAISLAQGFADDADLANVLVIRLIGGAEQGFRVDFRAIERGQPNARNLVLRTGDQVIVPELRSAYVVGEVNRPGEVALPTEGGLTVSRVLSLAGGFSERSASLSDVRIFRVSATGPRTILVDVKAHLDGDKTEPEPLVEPGDLVYVPRRGVL